MNLSELSGLLLSWVKNQGTALLQTDKSPAASFQAGKQYDAKVVDLLASGRHLVKVGSQLMDMNLPARIQVGDNVKLTYLSAGPRPTFLLNQAPVSPVQPVRISNTAQQVNTLLRLAQTPVASAPATSSTVTASASANTAATLSSTLLTSAAPSPQPANSLAAAASTRLAIPLLRAPSLPAAKITPGMAAASSQQTLLASAMPARPIAANVLMLQSFTASVQSMTTTLTGPNTGLLGQAVDAPRASIPSSTTLSANTLVETPANTRHLLPVRLSQTLSESGLFYESHLAKWSRGTMSLEALLREPQARLAQESQVSSRLADLGGMPEDAARMAGRQLQMLEGAPFLWQGQAWPGQMMHWLVREEGGDGTRGDNGEAASEWITELNLTLPQLGQVKAQLGLAGGRVRLILLADDVVTREHMQVALPLLVKSLELNGLQALELNVGVLTGKDADSEARDEIHGET